ncbi:MAG: TonB-dependent receptor [Thermoanaerobaculia bacterium]
MARKRFWLVFLVVPLLLATQIEAQGLPTGTLNGRVQETEGLPLPGVTVTAKSPALQGTRTAVTNVNGDFVLPNLPPGEYVISFVMSGFQSVTRNIKVSSGQQTPMNVKLSIAAVAAEAMVVAQSETVSQAAQAATTYSTEMTNKLPVTRQILASVVLSAGVNQNGPGGNVTISGAQSFDNVITVNGVNIQDNIRGTPTNQLVIEDAIQETTTMTSGVSAEFGRFTGGVINAVTKQGGNVFSGSFRVTLNNDNWQSDSPVKVDYTDKVVPTYEATLGGPIWKDRIWFFGAGRYNKAEYSGSTTAVNPGDPVLSFPRADTDKRYDAKLTISPVQNHTLTGSYTNGDIASSNYVYPYPVLDPGIVYDRQTPSELYSVNYNGVLSSNLFLEAQYSKKVFKFQNSGGRVNDLIAGTALLVLDQSYGQMHAPIFCATCPGATEIRDNEDILLKGTWFLSTKDLGSHNVVFGYDNFVSGDLNNNWQSGSGWVLYPTSVQSVGGNLYPVIDDSSYFEYYPIPQMAQKSKLRTQSLFVNDTWKLNGNWSFNLGLRYDKNNAKDQGGATTANDSAWSPRLSASWDVRGDGKLRATASYATYVGQIQEGMAGSGASSAGTPASYYYYWTGDPINANASGPFLTSTQVLQRMFAALGVTGLNQFPTVPADVITLPGVNLQIQGGISSPKVNEYVLGFGGTVGQNLSYRVDGVRREYKDFYTTKRDLTTGKVEDALGNVYDLGFLTNTNRLEREYTGLHTSLAWRTGGLNLAANWTWSHTIGNYIGETRGSGAVTSGSLENYPEYLDPNWFAPRGDLSQDQRHRVRIVGTYDFKVGILGITPGLVESFDTGTPYGAYNDNVPLLDYVNNPGYETPPSKQTYYFTGRGAYRTDDIWRTDLSLNLSANIGPVEVFVLPQVLNLFNASGITLPNQTVYVGADVEPDSRGLVSFDPFTTKPIECPQGSSAAQCSAMNANWIKGPNFGKGTVGGSGQYASFQRPRVWSISMGIRF